MATLSITTPDKFRVIYPWMPKKSIYSGDIKREGYWTPSGFTEPDALVTDRNSKIFLPDVDGVYQEVDQDKLSRTNRGLYVNGQLPILNQSSGDFRVSPPANTGWNRSGLSSYENKVSIFEGSIACQLQASGAGSEAFTTQGNILGLAGFYIFEVIIERGTNTLSSFGVGRHAPSFAWVGLAQYDWNTNSIMTAAGTPISTRVTDLGTGPNGGALRRLSLEVNIAEGTAWGLYIYASGSGANTNSAIVHYGALYPGNIHSDAIFLSPVGSSGTLFASDIRAVQGVRPSNAQPEPFAGWEAAGLDDGFTILLDFENKFVAPQHRITLSFNTAGNPYYRLGTVSSGNSLSVTCWDGTQSHPLSFGAAAGGRDRVALTITNAGAVGARAGSAALVSNPDLPLLSGLRNCFLGSDRSLGAWWNDWIYALHICKPLSDQEMIDWVNGVIPAIPTLNNIPLSTNTKPIISGTCDFNTTKIYVYVDGIQAGTALGDENDTWRCKLSLAPGTYQITARSESTIGKFSDYSDPITLVIADELSISGTPETYVQEGMEYSFTPTTTGGVPPYTYTLEDMDTMPDGMSIDPNTGELSGYPNPGIYEGIVIEVEDQE